MFFREIVYKLGFKVKVGGVQLDSKVEKMVKTEEIKLDFAGVKEYTTVKVDEKTAITASKTLRTIINKKVEKVKELEDEIVKRIKTVEGKLMLIYKYKTL